QYFVLARLLDLVGRVAMPGRVISDLERVVEAAVAFDIGPELPVLLGQKRMRPGGRRDKRSAPRALGHDPRRGGADLHTAMWVGARRIECCRTGIAISSRIDSGSRSPRAALTRRP